MNSNVISRINTIFLVCSLFLLGACSKDEEDKQPVVPIISDFSPASGQVGDEVTINGKHFSTTASGNTVKFKDVKATVKTATETRLVVTVPEGAATGKVSVTVNGETATSSTDFTLLFSPQMTGFSPASGQVGDEVTIDGKHFSATASANTVKFNDVIATVKTATETRLVVTVPEGVATGKISVTVNGLTAKSTTDFTVLFSPKITGLSVDNGYVGDEITIEGENFDATVSGNEVLFNETPAMVTSATATTLVVTVPEGATTGNIKVTVNGMTATSSTAFTVNQPPSISGFAPLSGIAGEEVTIQGAHFSATASENEVLFNGIAASVVSATETTLVVMVPEGASTGKIGVTVNGKEVLSPEDFTVLSLKQIEAGGYHTLLVKSDNTLWGFGNNYRGQLGFPGQSNILQAVKIMSDVKEVAAGQLHTLILKTDNTLWVTGANSTGQLGDGTQSDVFTPKQIMSDVKAIAAAQAHSLILRNDGTLWSTGSNSQGQLGNGSSGNMNLIPQRVMSSVKAIAAGDAHTLILKENNSLWVTGYNANGQLGDGTYTNVTTPKQIMWEVKAISAGDRHSMIIKEDNTLWGMGDNNDGQMGLSTAENVNEPIQIMANVAGVSAGYKYSLIVDQDQTLWGLGNNGMGLFHIGTNLAFNPTPLQITTGVKSMSAGNFHSLIYKNDNTLFVAGSNSNGQFGDGSTTSSTSSVSVAIPE